MKRAIGKVLFWIPSRIFGKIRYELRRNNFLFHYFYLLFQIADFFEIQCKMKYIEFFYKKTIDPYFELEEKHQIDVQHNNIWIFWWQGLESAPLLVKKCVNTVIEQNPEKQITVIDKDNLASYVKFPSYIYEKLEKNIITLTHFSDLIRAALLKEYGGCWVDATIYLTKPLPESFFSESFFSLRSDQKLYKLYKVSILFKYLDDNWTSFLHATKRNALLSSYMYSFYMEYWRHESKMIDYLMIDYLFAILLKRNNLFRVYVESLKKTNANTNTLNDAFKMNIQEGINKVNSDNAGLFKTTYKEKFPLTNTNGTDSYFNYWINESK